MILTTTMVVIMALMMMFTTDARSAFESTALSPFSISCLTAKLARLEVNWLPEMKDIDSCKVVDPHWWKSWFTWKALRRWLVVDKAEGWDWDLKFIFWQFISGAWFQKTYQEIDVGNVLKFISNLSVRFVDAWEVQEVCKQMVLRRGLHVSETQFSTWQPALEWSIKKWMKTGKWDDDDGNICHSSHL